MKRIGLIGLAGLLLAAVTAFAQDTQPLGDYARAARKDKKQPATKQFDNDNLPKTEKLSVVGNASPDDQSNPTAASQPASTGDQPSGDPAKASDAGAPKTEISPEDSAQDRQQVYDQWKDKISAQKDQLALLNRELDVLQREYRLRAAAFYADAGDRLRNSAAWDKEDAQYKQQIAEKQKQVDKAKQDLDDMQEAARKSGVPSKERE